MGLSHAQAMGDRPLTLNEGSVQSIAFSPNGTTIVAADRRSVRPWDLATLDAGTAEPISLNDSSSPLQGTVLASLDGNWIIEASTNGATLWPVAAGERPRSPLVLQGLGEVSSPPRGERQPLFAAFSVNSNRVLILGDKGLGVWNCEGDGESKPFFVSANPPDASYRSPVLSEDGQWLCVRSGPSRTIAI